MNNIKKISLLVLSLTFYMSIVQATANINVQNPLSLPYALQKASACLDDSECENVILKYKSPSVGSKCSEYGVYITILTTNAYIPEMDSERFQIIKGRKKKASIKLQLKANETLVAFVVSLDNNFAGFDRKDVGSLTAIINGEKIPIFLSEYEPDTAIGFLNPSSLGL